VIPADSKAAARAEAARLTAHFMAAGAVPIEADILQPADILLDLYGEDIRARAYVTHDPLRGEMMLRPDFTVPVVQMHMTSGADGPANTCRLGLRCSTASRPRSRMPRFSLPSMRRCLT
jgi:ATP phosphoribosyltransferase regulatory subunit